MLFSIGPSGKQTDIVAKSNPLKYVTVPPSITLEFPLHVQAMPGDTIMLTFSKQEALDFAKMFTARLEEIV